MKKIFYFLVCIFLIAFTSGIVADEIQFSKITPGTLFSERNYGGINNVMEIQMETPYLISTYEITNEQFISVLNRERFYVRDGGLFYKDSDIKQHGLYILDFDLGTQTVQTGLEIKDGWVSIIPGKEKHPVAGVNFRGALAFCNELSILQGLEPYYAIDYNTFGLNSDANGYRLPTETEWEYAAYGSTRKKYPWGNELNSMYANYQESGDPFEERFPFSSRKGPTTPVGYYDGTAKDGFQTKKNCSVFGVYDMLGNVAEWCWRNADFNVLRGGSYRTESRFLTRDYREVINGYPYWSGIRIVLDSFE